MPARKMEQFDQFPNRKYQVVSFAAATTTFVGATYSTEMGARTKNGWIIERIFVRPRLLEDALSANHCQLRFMVATGSQTAMLSADDDQVVAMMDYKQSMATAVGFGTPAQWPLVWIGPVLIASRQLTFGLQGVTDISPFQTLDMLFTVWYRWMPLEDRDWLEIAEAKGIF